MLHFTITEMVVIPVEFSGVHSRKKLHGYALIPITVHTCKSITTNQNAPFVFVATDAGDIQNNV